MLASLQITGTPETCFERLKDLQALSGSLHFSGLFSFAGLPEDLAEASIRLFAQEVLPAVQKLGETETNIATTG